MSRRYSVRLTDVAEADLVQLDAYLSAHASQRTADALQDELMDRIEALDTFPERGSIPKEFLDSGIDEFRQIVSGNYRIIYTIDEDEVFVVTIADGRRDMRTLLQARLQRRE